MQLKIYISGELLNLFDDEAVNFIAKATELNDVSKVFMDFTQTFSVPADGNNAIFQHYYDSDLDGSFNANVRIPAYIEINDIPFRTGKIQLESVKLNNRQPELYKITFYSDLKELSDLFGDDKLNELGYIEGVSSSQKPPSGVYNDNFFLSSFDHDYTPFNTYSLMSYQDFTVEGIKIGGDVIYPMISSQRVWRVGTGNVKLDPTVPKKLQDITLNNGGDDDKPDGAIAYTELKPGIRVVNIIKAIQHKYGVTFSKDFFSRSVFQQLYMWLSNTTDTLKAYGDVEIINFDSNQSFGINDTTVNAATDVVTVNNVSSNTYRVWVNILPAEGSEVIPYKVGIYANEGTPYEEIIWSDEVKDYQVAEYIVPKTTINPFKFRFAVQSSAEFRFNSEFRVQKSTGGVLPVAQQGNTNGPQTANGRVKIVEQMPDLKVVDFFAGFIKQFNLIIRPLSSKSFYVTTLNDYYESGDIFENFEDYIDIEDIEISRPIINKVINYKYQKTDNILGKNFRDTNGGTAEVGYGDLRAVYPIDSAEELKVELPFENMLFERLIDYSVKTLSGDTGYTNIVTGSAFNIEYKANKVKPILFFNNGVKHLDKPIQFENGGGGFTPINNIYLIGNENHEFKEQISDTINFNAEFSPWSRSVISQSLYTNYWERYISNIYNLKQRKVAFSGYLPLNVMLDLSLNDRININDKQYRINDYQLNLLDGSVKLNLVNNYFDERFKTVIEGISRNQFYSNGGEIYFDIIIDTNEQSTWTTNKTALIGSDTDWVEVMQESGVGKTRVTIKVKYNGGVLGDTSVRSLRLRFTTNDNNYYCIITQDGINY